MSELRELQHGVGTDLVRALLDELNPDEWVPRYAVVLLDAVDERDKRIAEFEAELKRRTKSRDMWRSIMMDMCSGERSVIKELESERDKLRKEKE